VKGVGRPLPVSGEGARSKSRDKKNELVKLKNEGLIENSFRIHVEEKKEEKVDQRNWGVSRERKNKKKGRVHDGSVEGKGNC